MPEIIPHPFKGEQRIFPLGIESRAAADAGDRPVVTVVGTDGSEDRHGSVINPGGWDIEPYLRNPVVLWGHQSTDVPAIGKTINLRRSGAQWLFDIEFATEQWRHMASNLAATTFELMRDGFLNAVSVSFIPKEWKEREAKTIPSFFAENVEYQKQELTEISVVNIGSNRNALQKALEAGKLTEEGARMLGLGEHIRISMPIVIVGKSEPEAQSPSTEPTGGDITATREKIAEILRCCGCYPEPMPQPEPVSEEAKTAEIATLNEIASECLDAIDTAVRGWKTSETDQVRSLCADRTISNMWLFDRCVQMLKDFYGAAFGGEVPAIDLDEAGRAVEGLTADRVGAVFSKKNLQKIDQIIDLASELRAAAKKEQVEEEDEERFVTIRSDADPTPKTFRISGQTDPGSVPPSGQPIRITATDSADSRAAEESIPPERDVYRFLLSE